MIQKYKKIYSDMSSYNLVPLPWTCVIFSFYCNAVSCVSLRKHCIQMHTVTFKILQFAPAIYTQMVGMLYTLFIIPLFFFLLKIHLGNCSLSYIKSCFFFFFLNVCKVYTTVWVNHNLTTVLRTSKVTSNLLYWQTIWQWITHYSIYL